MGDLTIMWKTAMTDDHAFAYEKTSCTSIMNNVRDADLSCDVPVCGARIPCIRHRLVERSVLLPEIGGSHDAVPWPAARVRLDVHWAVG
nr:hypothetical protein CFP56_36226 [Quercus suber]